MKVGQRLKSAVCDAEVMVIKWGDQQALTCGGVEMVPSDSDAPAAEANPDQSHGCLIGKRYVNQEETLEILCVKSGDGSLWCDGGELMTKDTKKLPSSD